jgi:cytochrome c oxidase subunit IV
MTSTPNSDQVKTIRGVLKYFKVTSYITGIFLVLIMILWGIRLSIQADLWLGGPDAFLQLAYYSVDSSGEKIGFPSSGIDITVISLIVHGWLYVAYLFGDFRLWTLMRWSFFRFLLIALGGIIPLLSFFTERHYTKVAEAELKKVAA